MYTQNKKINEDMLIFQAIQCANNYSEWDVKMMYSALDYPEKTWLNGFLFRMEGAKTNDKIIRTIAIMQDLQDKKLQANPSSLC